LDGVSMAIGIRSIWLGSW